MWQDWQVVECFFNQKSADSVGVEYEVGAIGVDVAQHGEESDELWGLRQDVKIVNLGHRRDRCSRLVF